VPRLYKCRDAMAITPGSPDAPGGRLQLPPRHHAHHDAEQRVGAGAMTIVDQARALAMKRRLRGAVTGIPSLTSSLKRRSIFSGRVSSFGRRKQNSGSSVKGVQIQHG